MFKFKNNFKKRELTKDYYYLLYRHRGTSVYWIIDEGTDFESYVKHVRKNFSRNEVYYVFKIVIPEESLPETHYKFDNIIITSEYILVYSQ